MSEYVTPTELLASGEDVQEIVAQSEDYVPYELLEPTNEDKGVTYVSKKRDIRLRNKVAKDGQKFVSVEISVNELEDAGGNTITLSRPLRTWVNSLQFKQRNRPGTTSSLSDYLEATGFSPKELNGEMVIEALNEGATVPARAIIGWTNQTEKTGNTLPSGKAEYTPEVLKTADFNKGTKEAPTYVTTVEKDGVTYKASHRLVAFRKI